MALGDVGGVGRADQHGAHLVAGGPQRARHHLQGDRVEPRAHRFRTPVIVPASSTDGVPARGQHERRLGQLEDARPARRRSRPPARRRTHAWRSPFPVEPGLALAFGQPAGPERPAGAGLGPGSTAATRIVTSSSLPRGRGSRSAPRAGARSPRPAAPGSGSAAPGDRQLEGLPAVAQLVDDLQLALPHPLEQRLAQRLDLRAIRSAVISSPVSRTVRAVSRRWPAAISPSAESTPLARGQTMRVISSSLGQGCGVHRAGAAEGKQGVVARIDSALDGDHSQRADHLLVGDACDPLGRLDLVESEPLAERGDRCGALPPRRGPPRRRGWESGER